MSDIVLALVKFSKVRSLTESDLIDLHSLICHDENCYDDVMSNEGHKLYNFLLHTTPNMVFQNCNCFVLDLFIINYISVLCNNIPQLVVHV